MADADLEEIRRARLAQLRTQSGPQGGAEGDDQASQQQQQQKDREADARASMLAQILLPEAAERLGRIRLVKASRATQVENRLITLAQSGQLRGRVTEQQLKGLLEDLAEQTGTEQKITVTRHKATWDDDDLDDLLDE